jgi:uncharacterized OsmC-like protein
MSIQDVAAAIRRVEAAFVRRPLAAIHDDAPAAARWASGMRVAASGANGLEIETDMPTELGGSGDRITPGWLFRAGLASCLATCIAMAAAAEGIEIATLEVLVHSRSDVRGLLGMTDATGQAVDAAPSEVELRVRLHAPGVSPERLRRLVEDSHRRSPVSAALRRAVPTTLHVDMTSA